MGVKTRNLSNTAGIDIEWQGVQTGNFTAVAGRGYFVDTTNNTITVTLPGSPSQGDTVVHKDYARTWNTNNVTLASALLDGLSTSLKKITKANLSPVLSYNTRTATGDGSTTGFTVTSGVTVDDVLVTENGVLQAPTTDYTISGTTLTFGTAPASGVAIVIRELP